jgi:DUF1365 family protein
VNLPTDEGKADRAHGHAHAGPAIIHGRVMHARARPAKHAFRHAAFCLRLPLSSLDALPSAGVARNRRAAVSFHDRDHGPRDGSTLAPWIRRLLDAHAIAANGEVVLYAFPRMLGYVFNPVSFWVCHDRGGAVRAVLAEVNNTFGESHAYLVAHPDGRPIRSGETLTARKSFHVSPFCDVRGRYVFRFHAAADRWLARVDYFDDHRDTPLLSTSIGGEAEPLSAPAVRRLVVRYGWFTLAVVARIHWHALRLWAKRVPFFNRPAPPPVPLTRCTSEP